MMSDQADAFTFERNILQDDMKDLQKRFSRRTNQLRASLRALRKEKKRSKRSEEHFFMSTCNMMVRRAAEAGLDHKLILLEGLEDLVSQ